MASGAIRGTEFHLAVAEADGRTILTLLDGEVALSNAQGELALAGGEQATVGPGQAPRKTAVGRRLTRDVDRDRIQSGRTGSTSTDACFGP